MTNPALATLAHRLGVATEYYDWVGHLKQVDDSTVVAVLAALGIRAATEEKITALIAPFNKKGIAITDASSFAGDLEFDSLTVMDFVAAIEDDFDIIISMNQQAEIETYGQLVDAVVKLTQ